MYQLRFSKIFFGILVISIHIIYRSCEGVSSGATNNSSEGFRNDVDDTSLIDEYLNGDNDSSQKKENISLKSDIDTTHNHTQLECICVKYYECQVTCDQDNSGQGQEQGPGSGSNGTTNGTMVGANNTVSDESQNIVGVVDLRHEIHQEGGTNTTINANGCPHYFDVRCKIIKNKTNDETESSTVTTTTPVSTSTPSENGQSPTPTTTIAPAPDEGKIHQAIKGWRHKGCGKRNPNGIGFTLKGTEKGGESQFAEFPWTAAIAQEELVDIQGVNVTRKALLCTGSLIHPKVVLTAAHQVFPFAFSSRKSALKVRLGEWDTQNTDEPYPYQDRKVKEIIIHEQLYRKGLFNDVALLILESEVKLAPNVDTICLPPLGTQLEDFYGHNCASSGWGKDSFGVEGRYQEIMKKVELPLIDRRDCQDKLRKTRLGSRFLLHESFICAGGTPGHDTCVGDGGSALACQGLNTESYLQFGIVSWGIGCNSDTPGVYVNVLEFVPWILQQMKKRNLDTSYATQLIH